MADRLNYYFRQKVTEAELDLGFENLELADQDIMVDQGQVGILRGMVVTQRGAGANLSVDVSAGTAYDKTGQRIQFSATQNVSVAVDENAVSTAVVGGANSKKISVFAKFTRVLTDPRTDGNAATVFFSEAEGFEFVVRQSAEAPSPTPVALDPTYILLADITRSFGQTTIVNGNIDAMPSQRREDAFVYNAATHNLRRGLVLDAFKDILDWIGLADNAMTAHLVDTVDAHDASAISYLGSGNWADMTVGISSTNVESALDEIISDLAATTGDVKIGSPTRNGANNIFNLPSGSVGAQIAAIAAQIDNGPIARSVTTISGSTGLSTSHRQCLVDTTSAPITLTLPQISTVPVGREFWLKDPKGTWGTNNLTLARHGSDGAAKIENVAASRVFAGDFTSVRVFTNGTDWFLD